MRFRNGFLDGLTDFSNFPEKCWATPEAFCVIIHVASLLGTELNQELAKRFEHKESKLKDSEPDKI